MESQKTISEIKLSFIRDQIRTLSASLAPNPGWREYGPDVEDDIPDKAVDDVLYKCTTIVLLGVGFYKWEIPWHVRKGL